MSESHSEDTNTSNQIITNTKEDRNVNLSSPIDRRKRSIEGSIIMTDSYNNISVPLSTSMNGVASSADREYDSGKIYVKHSKQNWIENLKFV